jgi:hypothetical protein
LSAAITACNLGFAALSRFTKPPISATDAVDPFSISVPSLLHTMFTVDSTRAPPVAALGRFTTMLALTMAIEVSMKMMRSTSTMSTKGMMLMLARGPSSSPL